jgi:hypothetical protein
MSGEGCWWGPMAVRGVGGIRRVITGTSSRQGDSARPDPNTTHSDAAQRGYLALQVSATHSLSVHFLYRSSMSAKPKKFRIKFADCDRNHTLPYVRIFVKAIPVYTYCEPLLQPSQSALTGSLLCSHRSEHTSQGKGRTFGAVRTLNTRTSRRASPARLCAHFVHRLNTTNKIFGTWQCSKHACVSVHTFVSAC